MKKTNAILITLASMLLWNCMPNQKSNTEIIFEYDTIQNGMINIQKTELVYNSTNKKLIKRFFYRNNPSNDSHIALISGIKETDSLILYSVDSLFYNLKGYDTIRKTYKKSNSKWIKNVVESKKYNTSDSLTYLKVELIQQNGLVEEFKKYNKEGNPLSITRYECNFRKNGCDSIFKEKFIYNKSGELKYSVEEVWKENKWQSVEGF